MKFSTFFLLLIVGLVAFAQAAPGDAKPAPVKGKPKPKPKPKPKKHHNMYTSAPSMLPMSSDVVLEQETITIMDESSGVESGMDHVEDAGVLALLIGVAVACVVAIVAVLRVPTHTHELVPQSSEHATV